MQEREPSGDYGYDLAHDDVRTGVPGRPAARRQHTAPVTRPGPAVPTGDLEHDEAHDFGAS